MQTEIHTKLDDMKETYLQVFDFNKIIPMPNDKFFYRNGNLGNKERKKYGLAGARKAFQFSKR